MTEKENPKKQVLLRLSKKLYDELAAWAEDDFRSLNGQIEYLLTECVKKRRKKTERKAKDPQSEHFCEIIGALFQKAPLTHPLLFCSPPQRR